MDELQVSGALAAGNIEEIISNTITNIRGERVIIDSDLAALYGVTTKRFNEQVKRNSEKFPDDFMFQLSNQEFNSLRSHFATSSLKHGGRRYAPRVFTEHGAIMAATVLNSPRAVEVSIYVVRAFVMMRKSVVANKELELRLDELERNISKQFSEQDEIIHDIVLTLRDLMKDDDKPKRPIGFVHDK